jgi:hypothetical protein
MQESVSRITCACGQSLWMERRWNGFYAHPVYFPDGQKPLLGNELRHCPACRRNLGCLAVPHPAFNSLGELA